MTVSQLIENAAKTNSLDLDLSNLGLIEFPKEIFNLRNLESLKLMHNNITKIPDEIKQLINLKHLYLYDNKIKEVSEDLLLNMPYLENFDLAENPLDYHKIVLFYQRKNRMFGYRENLKSIQKFKESKNNSLSLRNKSKVFPIEIFKIANIKTLSFNSVELDELPNGVSNLINLEYLDLSHNKLSSLPDDFQKLSKLKYLNLSGNKFQSIPNSIWNLPNIESLFFDHNELIFLDLSIFNNKLLKNFSAIDNPFENFDSDNFQYYSFSELKQKFNTNFSF